MVVPKDPENWPPEAIALANSLLRKEWLAKLDQGLEVRRTSDTFDPAWNRRSSHNVDLTLHQPKAWLTRTLNPEAHCQIAFCDEKQRGVFSRALLLGSVRASTKRELAESPVPLEYFALTPLQHSQGPHYTAKLEPAGENQVRLILTNKYSTSELRVLIDTARHVVLKLEQFSEGKLSSSTTYSDIAEIAGAHFAAKSVIRNAEDQKIGETTFEFKVSPVAEIQKRFDAELAAKSKVQFVSLPLPKLRIARQKTGDGSADFNDHLLMVLHYCTLQQWGDAFKHIDAIEKLAADKPGIRWLRTLLQITMRKLDDARQRLLAEAKQLAAGKSDDEIYLADFVLSQAIQVASGSELKEFVELIKPVYERQPAELNVMPRWRNYQLSVLGQLGRKAEAPRAEEAKRRGFAVGCLRTNQLRLLPSTGRPPQGSQRLVASRDRSSGEAARVRVRSAPQFTSRPVSPAGPLEGNAGRHHRVDCHRSADDLGLFAASLGPRVQRPARCRQRTRGEMAQGVPRGSQAPPPEKAKLDAAVQFSLGSAYSLSVQRMDARWHEPLAETARYFVRHKHHFDVVRSIFDYRFSESDAGDRLRG